MLVSEFLTAVSYALRGIDDSAPTFGEDEADYWVATLNRKKNELYRNSKVLFDETFDVRSLGSITADATPTYNTDATLIAPSDYVYAIDSNSQRRFFDIIKPRERPITGRQFYLSGMNPQVLTCTNEIEATDDLVGGTLHLPGYYMPADVSAASDVIPLPDPYWGVMAVAAEVAGTDITYEDREANLTTKANSLYMQMVRTNRRGTYNNPRKIPTNTYRIPGTERN